MKRPRSAAPSTSLFGNDSDSEDSSTRPNARFKPFQEDGSPSIGLHRKEDLAESAEHAEEDTLDAFMSNLEPAKPSAAALESRSREESSSESSEDFRPPPKVFERNNNCETDTANHARDLVLEPIDYSRRSVPPIIFSEYMPLPRLQKQSLTERTLTLTELGATMRNAEKVIPIASFQDVALVLPKSLLGAIFTSYSAPTPIQSLAIPAALHARDVIGVAKTGSGKTAAYAVPLVAHVSRQTCGSTGGKGPAALVIAPTRELALQIAGVIRRFGGSVCSVVGGHAKYEQYKRLRDGGAEVVVATPGRFIDMLKMRACEMARCSFVVLDEADRMLDMGFGGQVRGILGWVRPDAQRMLFSATFPRFVDGLAADLLSDPVKIVVSADGGAMVSDTVTESYIGVDTAAGMERWLLENLEALLRHGLVMVFCGSRGDAAAVANRVRSAGFPAACVHGETESEDREGLLRMFRNGELRLLITTDVSARGLDIADVRTVVNYGCAKSWEWHVHRVGRTGRAGRTGSAYTLVTRGRADAAFVNDAVRAYRRARVKVPEELAALVTMSDDGRRGRGRGRRRGG